MCCFDLQLLCRRFYSTEPVSRKDHIMLALDIDFLHVYYFLFIICSDIKSITSYVFDELKFCLTYWLMIGSLRSVK